MLVVKITPRRTKYVQVTEDNGGFYCKVYEDENGTTLCDDFYIDRKQIPQSLKEPAERRKKALQLADEYVRRNY